MKVIATLSDGRQGEFSFPDDYTQEEVLLAVESELPGSALVSSIDRVQKSKSVESPEGYEELQKSLEEPEELKELSYNDLLSVPMKAVVAGAEGVKDYIAGGATGGENLIDLIGKSYSKPEEEKGFIRKEILEAPEFLPTMAFPYGKAVKPISKLGGMFGKRVPQSIMKGGAEGLIEEGISGAFNGYDQDNLLMGLGVGGTLGVGGDQLGKLAYDKFKNLPTNRAFPDMTDAKKQQITKETYDDLFGVVDYNIPKRLEKISAERSKLGEIKEKGIRDAQEIAGELPQVEYSTLKDADEQVKNEISRVKEMEKVGEITSNEAKEYFGYLKELDDQYLKEKSIPFEALPETLEGALTALDNAKVGESVTDLNKLFKLRKTLDKENKKVIKKMAGGAQNITRGEAVMFTRNTLNDRIDLIIDKTRSELNRRVMQGVADSDTYKAIEALAKIDESLAEAKKLPSLYSQEKVLKNIGGGRVQKSSPYGIGSSGIYSFPGAKKVLPPSGIRERQLAKGVKAQPIQSFAKDYFYREDDDLMSKLGGK